MNRRTRRLLQGVATACLLLGALGIFSPTLFGYPARLGLGLRLGWMENSALLALGAWGAYVANRP